MLHSQKQVLGLAIKKEYWLLEQHLIGGYMVPNSLQLSGHRHFPGPLCQGSAAVTPAHPTQPGNFSAVSSPLISIQPMSLWWNCSREHKVLHRCNSALKVYQIDGLAGEHDPPIWVHPPQSNRILWETLHSCLKTLYCQLHSLYVLNSQLLRFKLGRSSPTLVWT